MRAMVIGDQLGAARSLRDLAREPAQAATARQIVEELSRRSQVAGEPGAGEITVGAARSASSEEEWASRSREATSQLKPEGERVIARRADGGGRRDRDVAEQARSPGSRRRSAK